MTPETEMRKSLNCLIIEVDESVARDVAAKVNAAFAAERERWAEPFSMLLGLVKDAHPTLDMSKHEKMLEAADG